MGNPAGVKRDFESLEKRRMQAARLLEKGYIEAEVARRVGVHRQSVNRWAKQLAENGKLALKKAGRSGRKPRLSEEQLLRVQTVLKAGAETFGYDTGLWTAARVGHVIEREFGIRYTKGHVWWVLKQLGWSCQRPAGRAIERDEEKIRRWKKRRWPELKKTLKDKGEQ
jgi:transposase